MRNLVPLSILDEFSKNSYSGNFNAITMFIDISGFTAMTQSLMKNGKEGAEILTSIINKIFTPSIDAIYDNGGFISTFAGDAFTSIFPVENSTTLSAISSAVEIQNIFRKIGYQESKFGNFQLSVKAGLSFGKVEWKIIKNDIQNAYYYRGEAVDNCAYSEHECKTGEIIFDSKLFEIIKKTDIKLKHKTKNQEYSYLDIKQILKHEKLKLKSVEFAEDKFRAFVPQTILDRKLKGEFRDIISCFISFKEEKNLDKGISEIINTADKYGGYFNKVDFGDKGGVALVLFGAPIGREKLNERAGDFALEVRNISEKLGLQIRMGLTFGKVFAGFVGSDRRCEYTALGMTVNLSARFMMKANWNEIYLDRRIFANIETMYDIDYLLDQSFKGLTGKVPVYLLLKKKTKFDTKFFEGELVGREKELQKLKSSLEPINKNQFGGIVYVDGIAGIGKSRLINELRESLDENKFNWFYLPCDEILQKSFNPFVYFLNNFFEQSEDNSGEKNKTNFEVLLNTLTNITKEDEIKNELIRGKSFLGALINLFWEDSIYDQLDAKGRYDNTLYAIKNFIKAQSLQKPVILELDDGHWIDKDSINLLEVLMQNIEAYPFIIISACRYNDDESQFYFRLTDVLENRIELNYLVKEASRNLINLKFKDTFKEKIEVEKVPEKIFNYIWERSTGNPFYIEQIILYFHDHKLVDENLNLKREKIEIPSNINAIIIARIDRLAEDVKEVIKTASVIGKEFLVKILSEMLKSLSIEFKTEKLKNVIETGEAENIWNSLQEIKYIFKHALIRESVYEIQLKERLRELHKLAADSIERVYKEDLKEHFDDLAFHYERAEIANKAILYLSKAGNKAKYNFQNEKALNFYERKLDQLSYLIEVQEKEITKISVTATNTPFFEDYVDTLFEKKYFLHILGEIEKAEEVILTAMKLAENLKNKERIGKANLDIVNLLQIKGKFDEALGNLEKAESIFIEINNRNMLGITYLNFGIINFYKGNQKEAFEYFEKELKVFEKLADKRKIADALGNIGVIYRYTGDLTQAMSYLKKQLRISEELKEKIQIARTLGNIGWVHDGQGDFDEAIEHYKKALKIYIDLGQKSEIIRMYDNMGYAFQQKENYNKAREYHQKALDLAIELDDKESIVNINANLGHTFKGNKIFDKALEYYDNGLEMAEKYGIKTSLPEFLIEKADLLFRQKKISEAKKLNNKGLKIAKEIGNAEYIQKGNELSKKID